LAKVKEKDYAFGEYNRFATEGTEPERNRDKAPWTFLLGRPDQCVDNLRAIEAEKKFLTALLQAMLSRFE
jgi:hypothetical protein